MTRPCRSVLALAALAVFGSSAAWANDQTILGSLIQLKNPSTPDKRTVKGAAKESASPNTLVGDPTTGGATLTVRADGTNPSSQTFNLPAGTSPSTGKPFWSGDPVKGFKYKDAKFDNGPIKAVAIKKSGSGTFTIKLVGSGKVKPVNVVPPDQGTSACILLTIGGGDSYSVAFLPGDGTPTNKNALEYQVKKPALQATCVTTTTTTTTSTTTTTIPVCSPNCGIGQGCLTNSNCASGLCVGGVCKCPNQAYTFSVNSSGGGAFSTSQWPGGTTSQSAVTGCGVTINRPNSDVTLVCSLANPFSINSFSGYSNCFGTGGEDGDGCQVNSCPPAGIGSCCNARPSCSAGLNGDANASYFVQCLQ
jgi:hypothetical protein